MNPKSILLPIVLVCIGINSLYAEQVADSVYRSNAISVQTGWFFTKGIKNTQHNQICFTYEHRLSKNWFIGAGYSQWFSYRRGGQYAKHIVLKQINDTEWEHGALYTRSDYKMVDIFTGYRLLLSARQFLTLGAGVTRYWGNNSYIDWYAVNPEPPHDLVLYQYYKDASYWGLMPFVSYDYQFLKNHVAAGFDVKYRHYWGEQFQQVDGNVHAKLMF